MEKYCGEPNNWMKCGCCNKPQATEQEECKCEFTGMGNGMRKCVRCGVVLTESGKRVALKLG